MRCPRSGGNPSGSDCAVIGGASTTSYVVADADVDRRLRVRVTAANADGQRTVASNATALIRRADTGRPANVQPPTLSGTPAQDQTLRVNPGTWNGVQPITFTFQWLRCDGGGNNCIVQAAFRDDAYSLREGDVGKTIRARVIARNSRGDSNRLTAQSGVVQGPQGPAGRDHAAERREVDPGDERARESRASSSTRRSSRPNPIRSQTAPFTVRIKVKDTRGLRRPRRARLLPLDAARDPERAGSAHRSGRLADS